jgi:carboxyl-terminal processing protease
MPTEPVPPRAADVPPSPLRAPLVRALLAFVAICARAPFADALSAETLKTFDACLKFVRNVPHNRARTDVDWDELREKWRPQADAVEPGEPLRDVLNRMLVEVGASHTAVLDPEVYEGMMAELQGRPARTFGVVLEEMRPGHLFVRAVHEQGPADRAGLLLGDEIVEIDLDPALASDELVDAGYDPTSDRTRLFFLRPSVESVELLVRSKRDGPTRVVNVAAESTSAAETGRRSVRIVERDGRRIGVLHLWMVARGAAAFVQEALRGELAGCDALVFDLRGRGGFADEIPGILAPFRGKGRGSEAVRWTKPVVFLVDDRTRSAKEILSWNIRHDDLGPLVGEKTEGAVLGAGFVPLPGGLYLEVGMMEVPVADGSSLEGVGVEPTVAVRRSGPWAVGRDPILEKGLELAAKAKRAVKRGPI